MHEGMYKDDKKHGLFRIIKRNGTATIGIFDEDNLIGGQTLTYDEIMSK